MGLKNPEEKWSHWVDKSFTKYTIRDEITRSIRPRKNYQAEVLESVSNLTNKGFQRLHAWAHMFGHEKAGGIFWGIGYLNNDIQSHTIEREITEIQKNKRPDAKIFLTVEVERYKLYKNIPILKKVTYRIEGILPGERERILYEVSIIQKFSQSEIEALIDGEEVNVSPKRISIVTPEILVDKERYLKDLPRRPRGVEGEARGKGKSSTPTAKPKKYVGTRGVEGRARGKGKSSTPTAKPKKYLDLQGDASETKNSSLGDKDSKPTSSSMTEESSQGIENTTSSKKTTKQQLQDPQIHKSGRIVNVKKMLKKVDLKYSVTPKLISGKNLVKNLAPGLIKGLIIGMITDYITAKAFNWLTEDAASADTKRAMIKIAQDTEPFLEKEMNEAIKKYAMELKYNPNPSVTYYAVVNYRLIFQWYIANHYIPLKMIIDNVFVTSTAGHVEDKCKKVSVDKNFSRKEGRLFYDDKLYRVIKCIRYIGIDFQDPGLPSLEGTWKTYLIYSSNNKQFEGELSIQMSDNDSIAKIEATDYSGKNINAYNVTWKRPILKFRVPTRVENYKGYKEYRLKFKKWDLLFGYIYFYPIVQYEFNFFNRDFDSSVQIIMERSHYFDVEKDFRSREIDFVKDSRKR